MMTQDRSTGQPLAEAILPCAPLPPVINPPFAQGSNGEYQIRPFNGYGSPLVGAPLDFFRTSPPPPLGYPQAITPQFFQESLFQIQSNLGIPYPMDMQPVPTLSVAQLPYCFQPTAPQIPAELNGFAPQHNGHHSQNGFHGTIHHVPPVADQLAPPISDQHIAPLAEQYVPTPEISDLNGFDNPSQNEPPSAPVAQGNNGGFQPPNFVPLLHPSQGARPKTTIPTKTIKTTKKTKVKRGFRLELRMVPDSEPATFPNLLTEENEDEAVGHSQSPRSRVSSPKPHMKPLRASTPLEFSIPPPPVSHLRQPNDQFVSQLPAFSNSFPHQSGASVTSSTIEAVVFDPTVPPPFFTFAGTASGQNSTSSPPTPTSPRNLNPSAPAFRQSQAAPGSPKNLNPSAPVFRQSQAGERSPTEGPYTGAEGAPQGLLTNGDIHANNTSYMVPLGGGGSSMQRGAGPQQQQGSHQMPGQGAQSSTAMGLSLPPHSLLTSSSSNHQPVVAAVAPQQQPSSYGLPAQDSMGGQRQQPSQQARVSGQGASPLDNGSGEPAELSPSQPNGAGAREDEGADNVEPEVEGAAAAPAAEVKYPEDVLAPIRKQMQFYFSSENLPNDKFLNNHMDTDKFIPLELFLDFGRIKPICDNLEKLAQGVESSSILELSEDRKKVRVSQCRKTLTLRGFPATVTGDEVRQFVLDICGELPTHIEFVMFKERLSVWYVSFRDEGTALNSFFSLHSQKAYFKDHEIRCCIKSSGTMAAAGYFPSTEESNQRRMAHQTQQNQAAAAAIPVSAPVQTTIAPAQPQQQAALMQQYNPMQLHPSFVSGQPGIYYQQAPASYMSYMAPGMITQGWPNHTAPMDPGIIMQNNGLQPQHIRTPIPRQFMPQGGSQPRFNRPQRTPRQTTMERSASERPSERNSVVSVTSGPSRSSPRSTDGSTSSTINPQSSFMSHNLPRRREEVAPILNQTQTVSTQHQFVTPLVTQQQQQHAVTTATTAVVNPTALEPVQHIQHFQPPQQQQQQQHQQSMMVQAALTPATVPPPVTPQTTSNPPPQIPHHVHHQPPPPIPQQQHHHMPHHQNQNNQPPHHHHQQHHQQQQQPHHPPQHAVSQHHQAQPPPHHQQPHHPHQQHMMPPPNHPSQHHHQMHPPPPPSHNQHHQHQQAPGNRPERRNRRGSVRNQRGGERNQSNRANFSSQAPAAADNFTMEANSFPPLPGAANSVANSEISYESKMSDVVRGINRMPGTGNGGQRAPSTTPSPVATPAPAPISSSITSNQQGVSASVVEIRSGADDMDSIVDDDATSSSQEEVDDSASAESRSVRSEPQTVASASEPSAVPAQPRSQKASTPVASPAAVSTQRQSEGRQGPAPVQTQARVQQQQQVQSLVSAGASGSAHEVPKLSYAQILAQKNREAANNSADNLSAGGSTPNTNSGTQNGPSSGQNSNNPPSSGGGRPSNQAGGAFRDQQNYQGGQQQQGPRSAQRGPSKDNSSRSDGPPSSSRAPNGGRRNSKENRSNKFDRRKPDNRQK